MSQDGQNLAVRGTFQDEITPGAAKAAGGVESASKRMERASDKTTKKIQQDTAKQKRSFLDAGSAGQKGAAVAGAGFSSMAAGFGAATAVATGEATALISTAASLAAAFGAGGPIGLAVAGLTVVVGALVGSSMKAGEAFKKMGADAKAGADKAREAAKGLTATNRDLLTTIKEMEAQQAGRVFYRSVVEAKHALADSNEELGHLLDQMDDVKDKKYAAFLDGSDEARATWWELNRQEIALRNQIKEQERNVELSEKRLRLEREINVPTYEQIQRQKALVRLKEIQAEQAVEAAAKAKIRAQEERELEAIMQREDAALSNLDKALGAMGPKQRQLTEEFGAYAALAKELIDLYGAEGNVYLDDLRKQVELSKELQAEEQKLAQARQKAAGAANATKALKMRFELAQATTEREKLLIKQADERAKLLKQGVDARLIEAVHAQEIADADRASAEELRMKQEAQDDVVRSYEEQLILAKTTTEEERARVELLLDENRLREEGGERAVELARELLQVQQEQKETAEKTAEAQSRAASELQRLMSGGKMDKGLSSRRRRRQAQNRIRKRRRELGASGRLGDEDAGMSQFGALPEDSRPAGPVGSSPYGHGTQAEIDAEQAKDRAENEKLFGPGAGEATERAASGVESTSEDFDSSIQSLERLAEGGEKMAESAQRQADAAAAAADSTAATVSPLEKGAENTERMAEEAGKALEATQGFAAAIDGAATKLSQTVPALATKIADTERKIDDLLQRLEEAEQLAGG